MAKIAPTTIPLIFCLVIQTGAVLYEPFPQGYAMGNLGTIIADNEPSGRSPFLSAAYMSDTLALGISASVTTYYDDMDNYGNRHFASVTGGGWCAVKRVVCKLGITNFDALGAYSEQTGFLSCAVRLFRGMRIGTELYGTRLSVNSLIEEPRTLGEAGFSLWIPIRKVSFTASVNHLTVKSTHVDGSNPPLSIQCGLHTDQHILGAQGIRFEIRPYYKHPVTLAIGQEFRFSRYVAIHAAVSNNPLFIGIGCAVFIRDGSACAAMVNHPVLGWSRGFSAEYGGNPSFLKKRSEK